MSAFVVSNIAADLKMLTNDQRFIFGDNILPEPLASFKIDNIFEPVLGMPSVFNFEMRNSNLSGFRWIHTTTNTDTFGSLKLQSFINAASTGTDILLFNQDGTVVFNFPVSLPGFVVSGDFDMNDYKIINLLDPVDPQDGATKAYVDSAVGGSSITLTGAVTGSGSGTINTTLTPILTSQISDFFSSVTAFSLDEFALTITALDLNSQKIVNLANPTELTDGANKGYIDAKTWTTSQITDYVTATNSLIAAGRRLSGTISMQNNTTGTTVNTANTFVKVSGVTSSSNLNEMSMPQSNRITYTGTTPIVALITCSFSATFNTGASNEIIFAMYKNGAQITASRISFDLNAVSANVLPVVPYNISITTTLNNNDYVELWVTMNAAPRTVTVTRLMMNVIAI